MTNDDFGGFFAAVTGVAPHPWQRALAVLFRPPMRGVLAPGDAVPSGAVTDAATTYTLTVT
jgi:hypothetical protein